MASLLISEWTSLRDTTYICADCTLDKRTQLRGYWQQKLSVMSLTKLCVLMWEGIHLEKDGYITFFFFNLYKDYYGLDLALFLIHPWPQEDF